MNSKIFICTALMLISAGSFSVCGQGDKYIKMRNVKANVDFAWVTGSMDFRENHSFGSTALTAKPMPQKVAEGITSLKPSMIRQFILENFNIEKENGELDFTLLDQNLRALNATGAVISAVICIKPKSAYPKADQMTWKPDNIKRWQYIIGELVKRYSVDNKYVTYWGIGNEVNNETAGGTPFHIPNPKDYFEWYKMTIEPVLKVFPEAKVGGPSFAGSNGLNEKFFDEFIGLCKKEKVKLDFVSYTMYANEPERHVDNALSIKKVVDKHDSNIEVYVSECNMWVNIDPISIKESVTSSRRAAGLAAILQEYHQRANFIKTNHYHIFDQFADPNEWSYYIDPISISREWNDEPYRLGLFEWYGTPYPQFFVYKMLYSMAKNEVAAEVNGTSYQNVRILASHDSRFATIFLSNYHPTDDPEDITMTIHFKDAREGLSTITVCRIDDAHRWDDQLNLIPTEHRIAYILKDFRFSIFVPANSVVMVTFDYDAKL